MARKLISLGGPSVGKGYTGKELRSAYGDDIGILDVGGIVRDKFKVDPAFKAEFEPMVSAGELLPDDVVLKLVEPHIKIIEEFPVAYIDGLYRTTGQLQYGIQSDWIKPGDVFCLFRAGKPVCRVRQDDRIKRDPTRVDGAIKTFENRWKS